MIAGPAGEGRVAWVARDDIADVALVTLTDPRHSGMTYDLTGPESHTLRYAAEQLSTFAGRHVAYRVETLEQAYAARASYGAPQFEVDGWVTSYVAVATGELDVVSPTVAKLAGHRPQTLPEFLAANPASYAHIAPS